MKTQHTPGPWTFSQSTEYGDKRFYVAQADGAPYTPHYSDVATLIAETVNDERKSIQEANACLIAAAPDLLESLEEVLAYCIEHGHDWMCMAQARAAVIKAKGKTQ